MYVYYTCTLNSTCTCTYKHALASVNMYQVDCQSHLCRVLVERLDLDGRVLRLGVAAAQLTVTVQAQRKHVTGLDQHGAVTGAERYVDNAVFRQRAHARELLLARHLDLKQPTQGRLNDGQ